MKRLVVLLAMMLVAIPLTRPASAKKLNEFQRKELQEARQGRKDEKAEREQRAKAICASCSVRKDCLEYALRIREPHGIWGGLNELERRGMLTK